jgi:hypothetical protein
MQNTSPVGLSLRGWLLDADACQELNRGSELRVLQMHCQVEPMPLALSAATISWLGVRGAGDAPELRLELRAIRTVSVRRLSLDVAAAACVCGYVGTAVTCEPASCWATQKRFRLEWHSAVVRARATVSLRIWWHVGRCMPPAVPTSCMEYKLALHTIVVRVMADGLSVLLVSAQAAPSLQRITTTCQSAAWRSTIHNPCDPFYS